MNPIRLGPVTKYLCFAIFGVFLIQKTSDQFFGTHWFEILSLSFNGFFHQWRVWQVFSFSFIHFEVFQLFFNLLVLAFIGTDLELAWGGKRFISFYLGSVFSGAFFFLLMHLISGKFDQSFLWGAGSGIYGCLMAYGILFSDRTLLFMMLFPMKAKHFVWVLVLVEFMTSLFSGREGISSTAHLGGMVFGFCYLWGLAYYKIRMKRYHQGREVRAREKRVKESRHLKLVINQDKTVSLRSADDAESSKENVDDDDSRGGPKTWH